jgi:hypothetical protein
MKQEDVDLMIIQLKNSKLNSTNVVAWYSHYDSVRGPYNRWFTVSKGSDPDKVAPVHADAEYCADAMNFLPVLIDEYEKLKAKYEELLTDVILLKDDK